MALLKTLEPGRRTYLDQDTLDKAWVNEWIIETALDHLRTFQHEFSEICKGATTLPIRSVMHSITEHIDIEASINETIHWMVEWQTLSILVTEKGRPVGLVRLSDLCDAIIAEMISSPPENVSEE